ncbi:MAG: discoidin domain-containing protein, partial [Muribaculaceae bacterium]|nr:discoidin domain-containing protein [Muribaculaceae bacterium]
CDFTLVIEGEEEPDPVVDYDLSSLGTTNRSDRYMSSVTLSDDMESASVTIEGLQSKETTPHNIYWDKSEQTFTTKPGATITVAPAGAGSWMHTYAYIDWAGDGFSYTTPGDFLDIDTDAEVAQQYKLRSGVDLVAFTRWCPTASETYWYNSDGYVGQNTGGNNIHNWEITTPFSFTLPADAKPGTYRMRVKSAWNQLDPNGVPDIQLNNTLASDGGCIVDFTLVIEGEVEPIMVYNIFDGDLKWTISEFCCEEPTMELPSGPIEKMIDNDPSTFYHSLWSNGEPHGTHYFVVDLKQSTDLYGFAWLPRQNSGSNNGTWMTYNVFVSDDASAFDFTGQINDADYSTKVERHTALENLVNAYVQDHAEEAITGTLTAQGNDSAESAMFEGKVTGRYVFFAITESNRSLSCAAELGFYVPSTPELEEILIGSLRETKLAQVTCYEGNVPGSSDILSGAVDQIKALGFKDFEANADAVIAETRASLQDILDNLHVDGKTFVIKNKRLAGMGSAAWLACVADSINSVDEPGENADAYWTVESVGDAKVLRNVGRQAYACLAEGAQYFSLSANSDDALQAAFNFRLKDNGTVALYRLYSPDSWERSYNIDTRGNGLTHWYVGDAGEEWCLEYAELPEQPDPRLEAIKARFDELIDVYEIYKESVPFMDMDSEIAILKSFASNAEEYLKWSDEEFYTFMDDVLAAEEELIVSALYDKLWTQNYWNFYQPGQGGYLCATTKSTNQGYDSFHFQSEADDNTGWSIERAVNSADEFYLRSAKGQYIATPNQHYCRVDATIDEAGRFTFGAKDGYIIVKSVAFPGCGLGLDGQNDPAEIMTLEDGSLGYRWQVSLAERPVVVEPQPVAMTVTPDAGIVDNIGSISFCIADADYSINTECADPVTLTSETAVIESLNAEELAKHYSEKAQMYYIDCNINDPGVYTLTIPEATFKGENIYNEETVVVWTIEKSGIVSVTVNGEEVEAYDLQGRRVNKVTKGGLYIINGVKTLVK